MQAAAAAASDAMRCWPARAARAVCVQCRAVGLAYVNAGGPGGLARNHSPPAFVVGVVTSVAYGGDEMPAGRCGTRQPGRSCRFRPGVHAAEQTQRAMERCAV